MNDLKHLWVLISFLLVCLLLLIAADVNAKHLHTERWYQDEWCTEDVGVKEFYNLPIIVVRIP